MLHAAWPFGDPESFDIPETRKGTLLVSSRVVIPAGTHPPGSSWEVPFAGQPGTASVTLYDLGEAEIIQQLAEFPIMWDWLIQSLQLDPQGAWCLLNERRGTLLPSDVGGAPGDFDVIVGRVHAGRLDFDYLAEIEVKVRKADRDGNPRSSSSGRGTQQAIGAAEVGFDRVQLLTLVVSEPADLEPDHAASWAPFHNGRLLERAMNATRSAVVRELGGRGASPVGYSMLGWAQIPGTDPRITCAMAPRHVLTAPFRPFRHRESVAMNRVELQRNLRRVLGTRRPPSRLFYRSSRTGDILPVERP